MTTLRKLAMLATAGLVAAALMACGDDDSGGGDKPDTGILPTEASTTDGPNPTDGGTDSPINTSSFPAYVQSLVLNKTDDKGVPDLEAVWGAIPDDEKFVFPATFFP